MGKLDWRLPEAGMRGKKSLLNGHRISFGDYEKIKI